MDSEMLKKTGNETWNMLRTSYKRLFKELLKISLIATAIMIAGILIGGVGISAGLSYTPQVLPDIATIPVLIIIGAVTIAFMFLSMVAGFVGYNAVDAISRGKEFSFQVNFKKNMGPVFRYLLVTLVIYAVIFLPLVLGLMAIVFGSYVFIPPPLNVVIGLLSQIFSRVIITVLAAIAYLFLQFAIFELIIGRRGAIESYKKSFEIVKKKPLETVIFSFVLSLVEFAIMIPLLVLLMAFFLLGAVLAMGVAVLDASLIWILFALGILLSIIAIFVFAVVRNAIVFSAQYIYWNKIKTH